MRPPPPLLQTFDACCFQQPLRRITRLAAALQRPANRQPLLALSHRPPGAGSRPPSPAGELPKGDDGSYGTSITWAKAMDPASDVILAYKQNGRLLTPDHGFPLR